jgi:hypothetical protein
MPIIQANSASAWKSLQGSYKLNILTNNIISTISWAQIAEHKQIWGRHLLILGNLAGAIISHNSLFIASQNQKYRLSNIHIPINFNKIDWNNSKYGLSFLTAWATRPSFRLSLKTTGTVCTHVYDQSHFGFHSFC